MRQLEQDPVRPSWDRRNARCEHVVNDQRPDWDDRPERKCKWVARFEHGGRKLCLHHAKLVALLEALARDRPGSSSSERSRGRRATPSAPSTPSRRTAPGDA